LKLNGLERSKGRVNAPARIDLAEAELVAESEEDQKRRGDSIEKGGTHLASCVIVRVGLTKLRFRGARSAIQSTHR
jgi:hypothetical protein